MKSRSIGNEVDEKNSIIKKAQAEAKILGHPEVTEEDLSQAKDDLTDIKKRGQVETASIKTNHHGILIKVTPTDAVAETSLLSELRETNFSEYQTFVTINSV